MVKSLVLEVAIYAVLVTGYFFGVLHFLGDWLAGLFAHNIRIYAAVALMMIVGQGIVLEAATTLLLRLVRRRAD